MKVIQGLDNQDLKSEEDQAEATAECSEMEVEQSVEDIKSKIAAEDININEKEEQSVIKGEETNGHDLKNGVDETKTVTENGVNGCAVKDLKLISKDSEKNTPETDSPISAPENKDAEVEHEEKVEDTISDNDTAKSSDKEESASAYESATNGEESQDETFESAESEHISTGENVKPTEEIPTSEDLMNDLEKLTQDEDELEVSFKKKDDIDNQEKLLDSGDDETQSEASPTNLLQEDKEDSPTTNLLQEDYVKEEANDEEEMPLSSSDPKPIVEGDPNGVLKKAEGELKEVSKSKDDLIEPKDEPNSESIADDEVFSEEVSEKTTLSVQVHDKDLDVKMECEDTRFLEQYPHPDKDDQVECNSEEKANDKTEINGEETTSIIDKEKDLEPEKEKDVEPEKEKAGVVTEKDLEVADEVVEKESSKETTDLAEVVKAKDSSDVTMKDSSDVTMKDSSDVTMDVEDDDCTITTADTPEPPVDSVEALGCLDQIRENIDNIFNDDGEVKSDKKTGSKRGLSESSESKDIESKKAKLSDIDNDIIDQESQLEGETSAESEAEKVKATKKKLKKQIKKLTRSELENILSIKMIEMMTNKSEMGKLRQQADSMNSLIDKWKKRAEGLRKQCTDLSTVMRKYIVDTKNKPKDKVRPVMITRSVGLQVVSSQQRPLNAQGGRGGLIRKGPGRPPGSSPAKPINTNMAPRDATRVVNATKLLPKIAQNGVVRNGPSPARSPAAAENVVSRPVVSTPQPRPRQMAGTTITPSKVSTPPVQAPATVQSTPTPSPKPAATVATATKTIDVVDLDLSDDEETPAPAPVPPPQRQMHTVQRGMVRPGFAGRGRGGQQFRMTSDERLVPVQQQQQIIRQQNQPRMMHRPMMGRPRPPMSRPQGHHPMAMKHPAPLPMMPQHQPSSPGWQNLPNRPSLQIKKNDAASGIVLSWDMKPPPYAGTITYFQLFAYQESSQQRPDPNLWKKVGDVKALPLPMACTLTQFAKGNRYHFAVRAMDNHQRVGNFSEPGTIKLD